MTIMRTVTRHMKTPWRANYAKREVEKFSATKGLNEYFGKFEQENLDEPDNPNTKNTEGVGVSGSSGNEKPTSSERRNSDVRINQSERGSRGNPAARKKTGEQSPSRKGSPSLREINGRGNTGEKPPKPRGRGYLPPNSDPPARYGRDTINN